MAKSRGTPAKPRGGPAREGRGLLAAAEQARMEAGPVGVEEAMALYANHRKGPGRTGPEAAGRRAGGPGPKGPAGPGVPARGGAARPGRGLQFLSRVLAAIAALLALLILAGTLYAVFRDSAGAASGTSAAGLRNPVEGTQAEGPAVFTGIGRLRIAAGGGPAPGTGAAPRAAVVLSVVFPYDSGDRPFTEELAGKVSLFRRIIRDYFGALSQEELHPLDEQRAKAELLRRFNGELQLGKITVLLFNDLMILE